MQSITQSVTGRQAEAKDSWRRHAEGEEDRPGPVHPSGLRAHDVALGGHRMTERAAPSTIRDVANRAGVSTATPASIAAPSAVVTATDTPVLPALPKVSKGLS